MAEQRDADPGVTYKALGALGGRPAPLNMPRTPADPLESVYVIPDDRFVVALMVGYAGEVGDAQHAVDSVQALAADTGPTGTRWWVFDRRTGEGQFLTPRDFS